MAELLLELYSEEIPPQLQIAARSQIKQYIENSFKEENLKYKFLRIIEGDQETILGFPIQDLIKKIKNEKDKIFSTNSINCNFHKFL